jgi:6-phosphogluconolactonase (cycloisomerase 2 family)
LRCGTQLNLLHEFLLTLNLNAVVAIDRLLNLKATRGRGIASKSVEWFTPAPEPGLALKETQFMRPLTRTLQRSVCLCAALSTAVVFSAAQTPDRVADPLAEAAATSTSPSAWVYVTSTPKNSSTSEIVAYTAAANGSLTAIPGSPFRENVGSMAVNGKYLMAAVNNVPNIDAFLIGSNGALSYAHTTEYAQYNDGSAVDCGTAGQVFFDHTGSTLYVMEYDGSSACANNIYASFNVVKASGALTYLGEAVTGTFPGVYGAASFAGNNVYAYNAADSACMYYEVFGFTRASNGNLTVNGNVALNSPTPPEGVSSYVPDMSAADPTNHVAVIEQPANPPGCASGPLKIATYTAASNGQLSTASTYANMPSTAIVTPYDMSMAPSGKLLAVSGQEGLQIFHFNGASPVTTYTGLLTTDPISQMFWDNENHLYAISQSAGKLFVYTITPSGYSAAPGSPYTVASPGSIIVQPLPRY